MGAGLHCTPVPKPALTVRRVLCGYRPRQRRPSRPNRMHARLNPNPPPPADTPRPRTIRSFVLREGRITPAQEGAFAKH